MMVKNILLLVCLMVLLPCQLAQCALVQYQIIDLGYIGDAVYAEARDLNNHGTVVGFVQFPSNVQMAFKWSQSTGMVGLGIPQFAQCPGGPSSNAFGVNNRDEVVGTSCGRAVLWDHRGRARDLGTLPGGLLANAQDINNSGHAVGYSEPQNGPPIATLWNTATRHIYALPPLQGYTDSIANAISQTDISVGYSRFYDSSIQQEISRATLWNRKRQPLDMGLPSGYISSGAYDVNNHMQAVGLLDYGRSSFFWSCRTGMIDLGAVTGGKFSDAEGINDFAQIAGSSLGLAAILNPDGAIIQLPGLAPTFSSYAAKINDYGLAAGKSQDASGKWHAVLWVPIR